jgi:large subunit ribosomal protein L24
MTKNKKSQIKIGDKIKVIAGNNKGFIGDITSLSHKNSTVFIEGITPRIKYVKDRQGGESQKTELQLAIHSSNVMLWDAASNTASRMGYKLVEGKKVRYFKKSGNLV